MNWIYNMRWEPVCHLDLPTRLRQEDAKSRQLKSPIPSTCAVIQLFVVRRNPSQINQRFTHLSRDIITHIPLPRLLQCHLRKVYFGRLTDLVPGSKEAFAIFQMASTHSFSLSAPASMDSLFCPFMCFMAPRIHSP
jgi:hypothetical protein